MGSLRNIITPIHKKTSRNYIERMSDSKAQCMKVSRNYDFEYWDGDRRYGYGGYKYDGRWEIVAKKLIDIYHPPEDAKILDVGCGKGYLLYEFKKLLPDAQITGFDYSEYAIKNSKAEIKESLFVHNAASPFTFGDNEFDLVISINTLFNLNIYSLKSALQEIERVGENKFVMMESYRNEEELFNLQCWALTCESFFQPDEWIWLFNEFGYSGDYEFIYFE